MGAFCPDRETTMPRSRRLKDGSIMLLVTVGHVQAGIQHTGGLQSLARVR